MWSRRHFANSQPGGILDILQNMLVREDGQPVVDNLARVALPLRRLRLKTPRGVQQA